MGRKKQDSDDGAPAYMQTLTLLWMLLLAFFILMLSMADVQESGFKDGIGEVREGFGRHGGLGLLYFDRLRRLFGKDTLPKGPRRPVFARGLVEGDGGEGLSDADLRDDPHSQYLCVRIPFSFPLGSVELPKEMIDYLQVTGMGLLLLNQHISVRSYTGELPDPVQNRDLAARRSASIMRFLHHYCGVPYARMAAVGYKSPRFLGLSARELRLTGVKSQKAFFYIYVKKNNLESESEK